MTPHGFKLIVPGCVADAVTSITLSWQFRILWLSFIFSLKNGNAIERLTGSHRHCTKGFHKLSLFIITYCYLSFASEEISVQED